MNKFKNIICGKLYFNLVLLTIILSYGIQIINYSIGVDDENINGYIKGGELIAQNRIGGFLSGLIFNNYVYLPAWTIITGLILIIIGTILWCYTLYVLSNYTLSESSLTTFSCLLISFPYIAKWAIFVGSLTTMGYILILSALATYFFFLWIEKRKLNYLFFIICSCTGLLLFDKAYITLFLQGIFIGIFIINIDSNTKIKGFKDNILLLIKAAIICVIAFLISKSIIIIFQKGFNIIPNGYTNNYIQYDFSNFTKSFTSFFKNLILKICYEIKHSIAGFSIGIAYLISLISSISLSVKYKKCVFIYAILGLIISTNLVYIITGNIYMPERSICYSYALFLGFVFAIIFNKYTFFKKARILVGFIIILLVFYQSREMSETFYKAHITYKKDENTMKLIMRDIEKVSGSTMKKPVIFMGSPNKYIYSYGARENTSIFVWDRLADEYSEERSKRLYSFFNMQGYYIKAPDKSIDFSIVREQISTMNEWPKDNSIKNFDDYIIVKLGDSHIEIIKDTKDNYFKKLKLSTGNIKFNVEELNITNNDISMSGWAILEGKNSYSNNISLVLVSDEIQYEIRVEDIVRVDVTEQFNDGFNYDNSGFTVSKKYSKYIQPNQYELYLKLDTEYGCELINLEKSILISK